MCGARGAAGALAGLADVRAAAAGSVVPSTSSGRPAAISALPALDRLGDHVGHPQVALERDHLVGSVGRRDDAREQLARRGHDDGVGLAERRQHLVDVAQEDPVRPDEQHAGARDALAVGVEQERGAVQGDRGLAGARAALHDEHAGAAARG